MNETERWQWAEEAYADYRRHRGAFGPIMGKEVEAAFFDGLRRGRQDEHERLQTKDLKINHTVPIAYGRPWKVEDAFEVWERNYRRESPNGNSEFDRSRTSESGRQVHAVNLDSLCRDRAGAPYMDS